MEEKNELNDIILNKGNSAGNSKKVILAVATLGVILIIVIMLMNTLASNGTDNLPQAVLPPVPKAIVAEIRSDEPLFEEVEIIQENSKNNNSLNEIAQKLKQESLAEKMQTQVLPEAKTVAAKKYIPKKVIAKQTISHKKAIKTKIQNSKIFYIQVGSFSKYAPNKKLIS